MPFHKKQMMDLRNRLKQAIFSAAILVTMAVVWIAFAPSQFGGQTSYVMVAGASMNPVLQEDDLVITRETPRYRVGDIVTYEHPKIGPVIHRITRIEGNEHFVLQGDNNDWVDDYKPVKEELIGRLWMKIPGAAKYLQDLRSSTGLTLVSLVIALLFLLTIQTKKTTKDHQNRLDRLLDKVPFNPFAYAEGLFFLLGVIGFGALLLGMVAFSRPTTETITDDTIYEHTGEFSYGAIASGDVYQNGLVTTGDPIFLELLQEFDVAFQYELTGENPDGLKGSTALFVEVSDIGGWRRSYELAPSTQFTGSSTSVDGNVDLDEIGDIIQQLESQTGLTRSFYRVSVIPVINIYGKIGSRVLQDTFSPVLQFEIDPVQLQLLRNESQEVDPLLPREMKVIRREIEVNSEINILGFELSVRAARWLTLVGLTIALGGAGLLLYQIARRTDAGGFQYIEDRYSESYVDVDASSLGRPRKKIETASFEGLLGIASAHSAPLLHTIKDGEHHFTFSYEGTTYHFSIPEGNDKNGDEDA